MEGDEIDATILSYLQEHVHLAKQVRSAVIDVRDVERFDLNNTDHARVIHWASEFASAMDMSAEELSVFFHSFPVARIVDEHSEATPTFMERLRRTELISADGQPMRRLQRTVSTVEEAAEIVGLEVKVLEDRLSELKSQALARI